VVAVDSAETYLAVSDLRLPEPEFRGEFVGDAEDEIESPTPSQQLLFGERRRRVPRWFDPARAVALGARTDESDKAAAALGRQVFFDEESTRILDSARDEFEKATGRSVASIEGRDLDAARQLLIVPAVWFETACAVAGQLRRSEKIEAGVLGLRGIRPWSDHDLRGEFPKAEIMTLLERRVGPTAVAVSAPGCRLLTASGCTARPEELAELLRNMHRGAEARSGLRLGTGGLPATSAFPKREILTQRLRRDYPRLEEATLRRAKPLSIAPQAVRRVAMMLACTQDEALASAEELAEQLADVAGPNIRGTTRGDAETGWRVRLVAGQAPLVSPTAGDPADVLVVSGLGRFRSTGAEPEAVAPDGLVLFVTQKEPSAVWRGLPLSWRHTIRGERLRLATVARGIEAAVAVAVASSTGEKADLTEIPWQDLGEPEELPAPQEMPLAARRMDGPGTTYDSVSRFWGQHAQPLAEGEPAMPDPALAAGTLPAGTATFRDAGPTRDRVPRIDPSACSGCGDCWVACPDGALGVVAIGTEKLLDAAAERAARHDPAAATAEADKLRRTHKQIASRLDGRLAKRGARTLDEDELRDTFGWLTGKMDLGQDESAAMAAAFEATLAEIARLPLALNDPFFHGPHAGEKGSGEALLIAVNPQSCQGCDLCEEVCPEDAIRMQPQDADAVEAMRATWRIWEELPDTPGVTISRLLEDDDVGPLAAIFTSRHCLYSVAGGDQAEPGSGERLALRQILGTIEFRLQRRWIEEAGRLKKLATRLTEAVQRKMAAATEVDDLEHLDRALDEWKGRPAHVGTVLEKLDALGERTDVDTARLQRLVRVARRIEDRRRSILDEPQRAGSARYGLVLDEAIAEWAAHFPYNPFVAPVIVQGGGDGPDLAVGIAESFGASRVESARLERLAELLLEDPSDFPVRERALKRVEPVDLTADESRTIPPLLLVGPVEMLARDRSVARLLRSELPLIVVALDGRDSAERIDPALTALAARRAFVLSASVAHPDHLFAGVSAAIEFGGPALIHVHTPAPRRHGFTPRKTVEQARRAVEARVHPLLCYDPSRPGVFGLRLDVDGNPSPDDPWTDRMTPAAWAASESRFRQDFSEAAAGRQKPLSEWIELSPDERGSVTPTVPGPDGGSLVVGGASLSMSLERSEHWRTLQELAGRVTPFAERVRQGLAEQVRAERAGEFDAMKRDYEGRLAELQDRQTTDQATRLRERLLQLAGYEAGQAPSKEDGTS